MNKQTFSGKYMKSVLKILDVLGLVGCWGFSHRGGGSEGEPFCGYFWDWLVVRVDCTRVKWVRWWLGG